jgi:subtilase family serine protease
MSRKSNRLKLGNVNRRAEILRSAANVKIEALERRLLFALANPVVTITLPEAPVPLQGVVGTPLSLDPQMVNEAYGLNDIAFNITGNPGDLGSIVRGDGSGETIAIVEAFSAPTIVNDLKTFDAHWGISDDDAENNFALTIQPLGGPGTTPGPVVTNSDWALQTTETVEWVHAVAPGASILLVQSPTANFGDLIDSAVYAAAQTGVVAVEMPWGVDDSTFATDTLYDGFMVTPNGHLDSTYNGGSAADNSSLLGGVTFLASAGDTAGVLDYPALSISTLSVGGSTLTTDINGNTVHTGAWADSGGGQTDHYDLLEGNNTTWVSTPLVSADANPDTGYWVYDSTPTSTGATGWQVVGGNALSTSVYSGLVAIIDQGLAVKGIGSLTTRQMDDDFVFLGETTPDDFESFYAPGTTFPTYTDPRSDTSPYPNYGGVPNAQTLGFGAPNPINDTVTLGEGLTVGGGYGNGIVTDIVDVLGPYGGDLPIPPTTPPQSPPQTTFQVITSPDGIGPVVTTIGNLPNLAFSTQPASAVAGQTLAPIAVAVDNQPDQTTGLVSVDTGFTGSVVLTVSELSPSGTTTIAGTTTVTVVNGIATFSDLHINASGTYELEASSNGASSVLSAQFTIGAAAASQLTFTSQPGNSWQFSPLTPTLGVAVEDQFGNPVSLSNTNVTVTVASGPSSQLKGTTTLSLSGGAVTFSNLVIPTPGTYTLLVNAGSSGELTTNSFEVVQIPITETYGFNGAALSKPLLLLQQLRNAPDIAAQGAPDVEASIAPADVISTSNTNVVQATIAAETGPTDSSSTFSSTSISTDSLSSDDLTMLPDSDATNDILSGS